MIRVTDRWFSNRMKVELRRYGLKDMKIFKKLLEDIPTEVSMNIAKEEAERLGRAIVAEIKAQPFQWPPLNPAYKKRKERAGLNVNMMQATEEYINSIGVQSVDRGKRSFDIRVGVPDRKHQNSNINLNDLAMIHELGTDKIPARPHWYPVYRRWKTTVPFLIQRIQRQVSEELQQRLRLIMFPESRGWKL